MNCLRILQVRKIVVRKSIRFVYRRLSSSSNPELLTDTFYQRSIPTKKLWWAKGITSELHVAGGLTDRQIKYARDNGFKSIVSLHEQSKSTSFGGERLPSSDEAKVIAKVAGLHYDTVLRENEDWTTLAAVEKLSKCISHLESPILLYASKPDSVAFVTLMSLAQKGKLNSNFKPQVNSDKFYKMSALMGMDFTDQTFKELVASVTGESVVPDPPKPNTHKNWLGYWLGHPLYGNWFTAGQIRRGHLKELEAAGFKSVINMRMGTTFNNKPSQETITLVNIKDNQDTYDENYNPVRQTTKVLESLVVNPALDRKYVSQTSIVNYESRNLDEYGDDVGYNEDIEREHFKESSLKYYHMPIGNFAF